MKPNNSKIKKVALNIALILNNSELTGLKPGEQLLALSTAKNILKDRHDILAQFDKKCSA